MKLFAPMSGWVAPLDEAPDPVFAGRMLGDGVAIDPTEGVLRAPCDGVVTSVAPTGHSVTLRAGETDILMHIGIETVGLGGQGFTVHVAAGEAVRQGQVLIEFDLDLLARKAKSLLTPILILDSRDGDGIAGATGRMVEAGAPLMDVRGGTSQAAQLPDGGDEHHRVVILGLPHGLHARPAARLSALAKASGANLRLSLRDRHADASSPVALMTLGAAKGDEIVLVGKGRGAAAGLIALADFLTGNGGEAGSPLAAPPPPSPAVSTDGLIHGVLASPGLAVGPVARLGRTEIAVPRDGQGVEAERVALASAIATVRTELGRSAGPAAEIMAAHLALIDDPALHDAATVEILAGRSAAHAWGAALEAQAAVLQGLDDPHLRERASDLHDLKRRVQRVLVGEAWETFDLPAGSILIADDLLPSDLLAVSGQIAGLCTARGGPTSHVAIIAASLGLPTLVAAGAGVLELGEGAEVVLDADAGTLDPAPGPLRIAAVRAEVAARAERRAAERAAAAEECRTADGVRIEVFANLGRIEEVASAIAAGAEGCGLLRTEFLFMDRAAAPDEAEQHAAYQVIADGLGGRPLIVRTLDIGGDKPVAYLRSPQEDNPALGQRGVRLSLARPDMLDVQLRAILRVRPAGQCRIMVPMVASVEELRTVRAALDCARQALGVTARVELGVMVETPAAAMIADALAREADFLSIGTNDLTQYALAMDRTNPAVASGVDALHPAVLRLIAQTCDGAAASGKTVGVCGGLASEVMAAPLLIGLGVTELSAASAAIPALKSRVRDVSMAECRALAMAALALPTAAEVRAMLAEAAR